MDEPKLDDLIRASGLEHTVKEGTELPFAFGSVGGGEWTSCTEKRRMVCLNP